MPNVKISQLPAATLPLGGGEEIPLVQVGITKRASVTSIAGSASLVQVDKGTVVSGVVTFNAGLGSKQKLTVGGNLTIAFTGWPAAGTEGEIEIELVHGGAFSVNWGTVNWLIGDGTSSTVFGAMGVTLQAVSRNWVIVWSTDGGVTLWGVAA